MFRSDPPRLSAPLVTRSPLRGFLCVGGVLGALLAVAAVAAFGSAALPLAVFAAAMGVASFGLVQTYPHQMLGLCNAVTLSRVALVAFLAGALLSPGTSPWVVFCAASLAFALDGLDGWLARRSGLVSGFGARFDMETDAGLAGVVALWVLLAGTAGPEVLALGFMRYAFVVAAMFMPALHAPLPEAFRRKVVCVIQISVLVLLIFPLTPQIIVAPMTFAAVALLSWSFLIDIIWLIRRRA